LDNGQCVPDGNHVLHARGCSRIVPSLARLGEGQLQEGLGPAPRLKSQSVDNRTVICKVLKDLRKDGLVAAENDVCAMIIYVSIAMQKQQWLRASAQVFVGFGKTLPTPGVATICKQK